MRDNEVKGIKCPFCTGSGEFQYSEIRSNHNHEKEVIAKFLKSKGMSMEEMKKCMGYRSDRSIKLLLSAGGAIVE